MRLFKACALLLALVLCSMTAVSAQPIPAEGLAQIQAYLSDKDRWTPAEQKLQSTLLYAARFRSQGFMGQGLPISNAGLDAFIAGNVAEDSSVAVTIRGDISADMLSALAAAGGADIRSYPQFGRVTVRLPLASLLPMAQRPDVQFITPTARPRLNRYVESDAESDAASLRERLAPLATPITNVGNVTSKGVLEHGADLAQSTGVNGAGIKICALSDSASPASIAGRQSTGDLPASVDIVENFSGSDEGTAMMEILYDMAPGIALGFATAFVSDVDFAANIIALQASPHNCNIIVDDVTYDEEGAFQDSVIAQAVNTVTAAGALYFSSAANSNNLAHNTSGTWEGDFVDGGTNALLLGGHVHLFSVGTPYDIETAAGFEVVLQWSDPWGASTNDYDLFALNSAGTAVVSSSTTVQSGGQDPFEALIPAPPIGSRIVVVRKTGAATRALRIDASRGRLQFNTNGSTYGHNAAGAAYTVAATELRSHPATQFSGSESVQAYSSDGPRRIFYNPNGTAITPGNVLFGTGGGTTLNKVDITAGDCGGATTPGFSTFCGTSAAAPHAAAIAGLLKQAKPSLTAAQIKTALFSTAIDIEAPNFDVTAGNGIVMADRSLRSVLTPLAVVKQFVPPSIPTGGITTLSIALTNSNDIALKGVVFTDTYPVGVKNAAVPSPSITGSGCTGTLTGAAGGGSLALTAGTVPAHAACTYTVNVTSTTDNVYVDNSGAVTTPIGLNTAAQTATLTVGTTPILAGASSRRVHGAAGTFDLTLSSVATNPTTEPRQGPAQTIVFTFNKPIASATVAIPEGAATAGSPSFSGNEVIVGLTGVSDQQYVTITLSSVTAVDGGTGGSGSIRIGFLAGDVNQSRVVTVADVGLVNAQLAQTVTAANFLRDVNANGTLSVADKAITNANLTRALPAP